MAIFQTLNAEGKTIVLITHDESIASMASRVVEIVDGRIVSDRPVEEPRDAARELDAWQGNGANGGPVDGLPLGAQEGAGA
jgi:putative ABC transport system ATP-binding protein